MPDQVTLEVFRYRPEMSDEPVFDRFEVPYRDDWTVLDGLNYVKDRVDGTLSYRWSCRMGVCGSCGMTVNGEPVLTCASYLEDHLPGPIRVGPLRGFPVVRDLVGDISDFIQKLERVKPWIIPGGEDAPDGPAAPGQGVPAQQAALGPSRQTPDELAQYKRYSACINCMLCYAACPIYELEPGFLGPAAIALAQRYNLDSRDAGGEERRGVLADAEGVWPCTFVGECSVVCPKDVDPAGAIQRYKLEAAMSWLGSFLPGRGG